MKRKIMAAAAALIIAITSFAACSENAGSSSSSKKSDSVSSIVAADIDVSIKAVDYEVGYDESGACKVSFDGFPSTASQETIRAWTAKRPWAVSTSSDRAPN